MLGLDTSGNGSGGLIDAAKETAQDAATDSDARPGFFDDPLLNNSGTNDNPTAGGDRSGVDPMILAGGAVAALAFVIVVVM